MITNVHHALRSVDNQCVEGRLKDDKSVGLERIFFKGSLIVLNGAED